MNARFCRVCHEFHPLAEPWPWECRGHFPDQRGPRSSIPFPNIRRDHMNALMHPGDAREYTSRSDYDAVTKRLGLIEVGDCSQKEDIQLDIVQRNDVMEAIAMVEQGYKPKLDVVPDLTGKGWE